VHALIQTRQQAAGNRWANARATPHTLPKSCIDIR
jgi:hypothetical protein